MSDSFVTPWTVGSSVHGFPRQEYWSGLPFPPPGDLPNPGMEPASPALQVDSLPLCHQGNPLLKIIIVFTLLCLIYKLDQRCVCRGKILYMKFGIICDFRHLWGILDKGEGLLYPLV